MVLFMHARWGIYFCVSLRSNSDTVLGLHNVFQLCLSQFLELTGKCWWRGKYALLWSDAIIIYTNQWFNPLIKNEEKIRGKFVASAPPHANIACLSPNDPFFDKLKVLPCMVGRWRWKLSWHHTRCKGTCKRRPCKWCPCLSWLYLFLSSPPPYTLCHFITLTTFSHFNKH